MKKFLGPSAQIRWLIRRDMPEVLEIERESFEFDWSEEDFLCCLRQRYCIGMVAELHDEICGFMVYEMHKATLRILNFAVAQRYRRQGVGTAMTNRLIDKLSQQRRKEIVLEVREGNLPAQLFFAHQGFRGIQVLRNHYSDTPEDAYVMQYLLDEKDDPFSFCNRISAYDIA